MEAVNVARSPENLFPASYWNSLSADDKSEFLKIRNKLHQNQKISIKDSRLVSFSNEMITILKFLERTEQGREQRSVLAGVAFAGPYICVNTRQLKNFLGRCKSSINGSFQQLGYVAVKTKSKAKTCVLSLMPSLANEPTLLRQWTVRGASDDAITCFVSKHRLNFIPSFLPSDLNEEKKHNSNTPTMQNVIQKAITHAIQPPKQPIRYTFELTLYNDENINIPELTPSYSLECSSDYDNDWDYSQDFSQQWNPLNDDFILRHSTKSNLALASQDQESSIVPCYEDTSIFFDY